MSHAFGQEPFPRGPLIAAGALVAASLVLAAVGSIGRVGRTELPVTPAVASYDLRFAVQPDGSVAVAYADGRPAVVLGNREDGFVRGVLHSVGRERRRAGVPTDAPLRLTRYVDGRLALSDPPSGLHVDLAVFGPTNAESFARLWRAADADSRADDRADGRADRGTSATLAGARP
jgi:putative photosynthetic complex assembly protein